MSDPISLRNIPPDALTLARALSAQTGLSLNALFRLALTSGLLIKATKVTPGPNGTLGRLEPVLLAKALRRHLSSAIDLLIEYGEHPYQGIVAQSERTSLSNDRTLLRSEVSAASKPAEEHHVLFEDAIGDDLEMLGMGVSLAETIVGRAE